MFSRVKCAATRVLPLAAAMVAGAVSWTGCTTADEPVVAVGQILFADGSAVVAASPNGSVSSPLVVEVTTVGDGCTSLDSTVVDQQDDGGDLTPYDRRVVPKEGTGCPQV